MSLREGSFVYFNNDGSGFISRATLTEKERVQIALLDAAFNADYRTDGNGPMRYVIPGVGTKVIFFAFDPDYALDPNFSLQSEK